MARNRSGYSCGSTANGGGPSDYRRWPRMSRGAPCRRGPRMRRTRPCWSRESAATTSRWRSARSRSADCLMPGQRCERRLQLRDQVGRAIEVALGQSAARIAAMQGLALRAQALQCMVEPLGAGTRTRAAQDRAFQQRDRGPVREFMPAEPAQRMLEQRQQRHRLAAAQAPSPPQAARRCRPSYRTADRRRNRRPGTFQRASAATTRRAKARSGVISAAVRWWLSGPSLTASRSASAIATASSSVMAASISERPAGLRPCGPRMPRLSACRASWSVASAGRIASDARRSRP